MFSGSSCNQTISVQLGYRLSSLAIASNGHG